VLLLIKNIKFKEGKLVLKFINLFKIFKYIRKLAYKLELLSIYNYFYFTFYISLLKECNGIRAYKLGKRYIRVRSLS
jgi:hypothetical protein